MGFKKPDFNESQSLLKTFQKSDDIHQRNELFRARTKTSEPKNWHLIFNWTD